jgi:predicted O-linked N-acetylglucosamine transferase (SPINDLY family)
VNGERPEISILSNVGLTDFIAGTEAGYVRLASGFAADLTRLSDLRAGIRDLMRRSPLMDAERFARGVELAYRQMWTSTAPPASRFV